MAHTPPILKQLLQNKGITDICLNGTQSNFIDDGSGMRPCPPIFSDEGSLRNWILEQLSAQGKAWDARYPFAHFILNNTHRIHVVFPPASAQIFISIRKLHPPRAQWQQQNGFAFLNELVQSKKNILITGATGSGKTSLLNLLIESCPESERIIGLEDIQELSPNHRHFIRLVSREATPEGFGQITLAHLLRESLRMRPDRLLLGECRSHEVWEFLQLLNTGHQGAFATLHANHSRDAIRRLEVLLLLSSQKNIPMHALREWIANGLDWIVHVKKSAQTSDRWIDEMTRIEGQEGDTVLLRPMLKKGAWLNPNHPQHGATPSFHAP